MKKSSLFILLMLCVTISIAQNNSYPETGDVEIKSGKLLVETSVWRESLFELKDTRYTPTQLYRFQIESDGLKIKQNNTVNYQFLSGGDFLINNGKLGIGIIPTSNNKLHVAGRILAQNEGLYASGDKGSIIMAAHTGYYAKPSIYSINTSGAANDMLINPAGGNVGIGTSTPSEKLEVNGRILSRMINSGGWDAVFGVGSGNGLIVGTINGNTNISSDRAHVLYRNSDGGIYYGYNNGGLITTQINSQNNGDTFFASGGNFGIGTQPIISKLHIADGNGGEQLRLSRGTGAVRFAQDINQDNLYLLNKNASLTFMFWKSNGYVGIGTNNPTQKLTVNGTVYSTEVKVDVNAGTGPDYVFEPTYQLPSLTEIENYIKANKHLPEVPSAKEMETNGINLSEMNMLLLKKVEELTLYVIELKKEMKDLKSKIK